MATCVNCSAVLGWCVWVARTLSSLSNLRRCFQSPFKLAYKERCFNLMHQRYVAMCYTSKYIYNYFLKTGLTCCESGRISLGYNATNGNKRV